MRAGGPASPLAHRLHGEEAVFDWCDSSQAAHTHASLLHAVATEVAGFSIA